MVIKKYNVQNGSQEDRARRLDAYATQGRSYRKTQKNRSADSTNLMKGTLAALIPLAAAGTLNAQCQGPVNGGMSISIGTYGTFKFDVNGDNVNDFSIYHYYFGPFTYGLRLKALGPDNYFRNANSFSTVTRGQGFHGPGFGVNMLITLNPPYIGLRKGNATTGDPGWMEYSMSFISPTGGSFRILQRGVENDGDNSAITGDCASMSAPLPVEMLYFNSKADGKNVVLDWATASEINNEGFEVQRSTDGRKFAKIGWVPGHGNTVEQKQYSFIDDAAQVNTTYYYRLKQMDTDGTEEFSAVRTVALNDGKTFSVSEPFPNPAGQGANFRLNMPEEGEVVLQVFDLKGSLVKAQSETFSEGASRLHLSTADLPGGQYYVKLQLGRAVAYRKLTVK